MLPASVLPEKTEVCRLYFYLTLPNRWCAQMRRTERRGYRMAKAVELLVEVRRRTANLVPAASAKRSLPNGTQMRRSWLQLEQGTTNARARWRAAKERRGDARETFFIANIARSSDCCVAWVVCGFRICGTYISGSLFF